MAQDKFDVGGMTCAACQAHVDRAVSKLDGVQSVAVNLLAGSMLVDYDPAQVTPDDICTAVDRAGYSASPVDAGTGAAGSNGSAQARSGAAHMESPTKKLEAAASAMRTRLIISIIFLIPLFYIGMGHMLGWPLPGVFTDHTHSMTLALTELVLLIPIVYVNDAYFINGFKSLAHGAPTMDALIAVGATASIAWSLYAMFIMADQLAAGQVHEAMMTGMDNLYFESAGTILSLVTVGKYLETRSKSKTGGAIEALIDLAPKTATIVADDGTETDLDLGHYERFIDENLNKYSNLTTGKVYWNVLNKERQGAYLGQTVQIIPHITNEIKSYIYNLASSTEADVVITEIGGTTGDIESQPFLEAIRQVGLEQGRDNCCYIHVVLVPYISGSDEYKSKPAQHSVKELQGMGVNPDIIILRADGSVGGDIRRKISTFCNVKPECVIENLTMPSLYQCPLMLHTGGLDEVVVQKLKLNVPAADLTEWKQVVSRIATRSKTCSIALVGKYVKLHDAYLSVMESLYHAGFENDSQVEIKWVESEDLTDQAACKEAFADVDGIIVPGGFGDRGIEGMIQAARYAREQNIPYFGICLGMQIMVMEYARDVLGYADANSSEFTPDGEHNVIALMPDQQGNIPKGGTMRLGKYPCITAEGTKLRECYGKEEIDERHRHRYEFNNDFRQEMQDAGLVISGTSPDGHLVETVELPGRDFHLGAQFHPEFKSRPNRAHPLFKGFIAAALKFRIHAQRGMMHV